MAAKIIQIYRTGNPRFWTVVLSCGHKLSVTNADLKAQQLFVGKGGQTCVQCSTAAATALRRRA